MYDCATYLFPHGFNVLKRLVVCDGVDDYKPLTVPDIKVPHGSKLFSSSSVQNFQHRWRTIHFNLLPVEVFYRWIILFHETSCHKLYSQGTLSNTTRAKNDHFELSHLALVLLLGRISECGKSFFSQSWSKLVETFLSLVLTG